MKSIFKILLIGTILYFSYTKIIRKFDPVREIEYKLTTTSISNILSDPSAFENLEVTVNGKVTRSFNVFGVSGFVLDDGTGQIHVNSGLGKMVPNEGTLVKISGRVQQYFKLGNSQITVLNMKNIN